MKQCWACLRRAVGRYAVALLVFFPTVVNACPVCFTDPESPTSSGITYAIITLLGVTGTVLGGFVGMFLYLRHRSKKITLNGSVDYPSTN